MLSVTGESSIVDLNFIFTLNFLEIDKDYNNEVEKENKKRLQQQRARY